ncbi:hypothetical protein ACLOJK_025969 [Asimina triloba]
MIISPCVSLSSDIGLPHFNALVAPIAKDTPTSLYTLTLYNRSYVLDLTGNLLWFRCRESHPQIPCRSHTCITARSFQSLLCPPLVAVYKRPCCCVATPINPITQTCAFGDLTTTNLTIFTTEGRAPLEPIAVPRFISSCAPKTLLGSLPSGAAGMAGLARSRLALPTQLTAALSLPKQFALCLPSEGGASRGVAFFGGGPFVLLPPPGMDVTRVLTYAQLARNQMNDDYYIDVKGVAVGGQLVRFLARVLVFDSLGRGGVKLSTAVPYTTLKSHCYRPFLEVFARATVGIPRVPALKPFNLCLNTSGVGRTRVGLAVPQIDLMMGSGKNWTILGANSMKQVSKDVACLAIVDGGPKAEQAVVIGSFQMENNFLLFDLARGLLGFSSSLLFFRTTCANFNFSSLR